MKENIDVKEIIIEYKNDLLNQYKENKNSVLYFEYIRKFEGFIDCLVLLGDIPKSKKEIYITKLKKELYQIERDEAISKWQKEIKKLEENLKLNEEFVNSEVFELIRLWYIEKKSDAKNNALDKLMEFNEKNEHINIESGGGALLLYVDYYNTSYVFDYAYMKPDPLIKFEESKQRTLEKIKEYSDLINNYPEFEERKKNEH